jgi:outer membrane translocation and assembly module TamA
VLIGGTEVILRGGARTDKDYLDLLKTRPAIGTVLNQGTMTTSKSHSPAWRCAKVISTVNLIKASLNSA